MPSPSSKVILSFNKGELSPFLDSRVDLEGATSAAREMTNMYAEVGGEARRRPGLRMVSEVPEPPPFTVLTNYIEVPFVQWVGDYDAINIANRLSEFRGLIRLWESGTIQFIGEGRTTRLDGKNYQTGTGIPAGSITKRTVVAIDANNWAGTPTPANWSYRLGSGEKLHLVVGLGEVQVCEALAYPTGWVLPLVITTGGFGWNTTMSRSGDNLRTEGTVGGDSNSLYGLVSYHVDTTTWAFSSQVIHLSGLPVSPYGPIDKSIPDSPTQGAFFDHQFVNQQGGGVVAGNIAFGPVLRTAYSTPTIQQGIDPET